VKPFEIGKRLIYEAWEKVRANKGAPGVDAVSIGRFEEQLKGNLYKLWNRMSSGSYFPGPVRGQGSGKVPNPSLMSGSGEVPLYGAPLVRRRHAFCTARGRHDIDRTQRARL